jgi:hypothetical protein
MTLVERRAPGPFTTRWYNDPVLDGTGGDTGETRPVWSIVPESLIVSPMPYETIERSAERELWGWAWADGGVRNVYVRTDEAAIWRRAEIQLLHGREWQRFSIRWMPRERGAVVLASLAEAIGGLLQPISGRRNAIHDVPVNII